MLYPNFIKSNATIGVTAPSDGSEDAMDKIRLNLAKTHLESQDFSLKLTPNCYTSDQARSSKAQIRAKEFHDLIKDPNITSIICFSGGEFLIEMLPYLDWSLIKQNPKWIQGYSDPTSLLFTITTNLDIATIYGANFKVFAMEPWHHSLITNLEILQGNIPLQYSFDKYASTFPTYETGKEGYNLDTKVNWLNLNNEQEIKMTGRLIGGCLDCLLDLIGTKFDKTKEFIQKYKNDGIIWYFDVFSLTSEELIRAMWHLKNSGWFNHTSGVVFGRPAIEESYLGISFIDAIKEALNPLNIPVIINADIGHKPPQLTIINGSLAQITSKNGRGTLKQILK